MPYSVAKPKMLRLEANPGPRMPYSLKQTPPASSSTSQDQRIASFGWIIKRSAACIDPSDDKRLGPSVSFAAEPEDIPAKVVMVVELVTFADDIPWSAPKDSAFLMVDAKDLHDTIGDWHHTGAHTSNLNAVLANKTIPLHFKSIRRWVREQITSKKTPIYLGMSCNLGTHSSVSLATLVQRCLIVAEGCQVNLVHMAETTRFECGQKQPLGGACHECTDHDTCPVMKTLRADCFSMAVQLWQNVEHMCSVNF